MHRITDKTINDFFRGMSIDLESVEGSNSSGCSIEDKLPTKNCLIRGKEGQYAIGRKIAQGRYGAVFEVLRKSDGKRLACKLEVCETHSHGLDQDYVMMNKAAKKGCQYLIHMLDRGKIEEYFKFIIMPLLGDNLMSIKNMFEDGRLSLSSGIRLSYHALFSLQELHNTLHFVHRDIKPSNFCLPAHYNEHNIKLILIDYGICRSFKDKNGEWKNPRENVPFRGTTRYAPLAAHYGKEQSPKDDLEAWLYMMVEFVNGTLPWSDTHKDDRNAVKELKEKVATNEGHHMIMKYCPRVEFRRIQTYIQGLHYQSTPDYNFLFDMLLLAMRNNQVTLEEKYDWQDD